MLKEGIIEEVVTPLVKQLGNARSQALKFKENEMLPEINLLFDRIEKNVEDMEDAIRRAERWEKDVISKFGIVARHVDDILEEESEPQKFKSTLRNVDWEIANLRALLTPPLQLPQIESASAASTGPLPSLSQAPQASEKWRQLELEKKILESSTMSSLQVSYENLDVQLKLCLLCFSVFPENSVIRKRPVIYWWIGEGLVTPRRDNTAEEIGERCFSKLVMKGLIEPVYMKRSPVIKYCKLHPWMRWMLIAVARRVQFFDFDSEGNPTSDYSVSRRACLVTRKEGTPDRPNLGRWQNLPKHHIEVENTEFLEELRSFKHLRYLSFQGISRITELPASISENSNIRILDLRACHNLESLPVGIASLKKLTHLDVSECYLLEQMPKGIALLSELEVLKGFVIGDARSKDACQLSDLPKLKKLRKLSMMIGYYKVIVTDNESPSEKMVTDDELNELRHCEAVRSLTITWVASRSKKGTAGLPRTATMTPASPSRPSRLPRTATMRPKLPLRPPLNESPSLPPKLEKLDLRCFPGKMVPDWLRPNGLTSLKKLYIRGGMLASLGLETLPSTWNVEVLRLKFLRLLKVEWSQIRSSFQNLAYLEIVKCSELISFPCDKDGVWVRDERET
ncbi:disease resistance RPP13-like protein 4 [Cocos nucifera]|uniref:Disease resistance RPP13-like protein 4 n=1 Tax=Cocos nucifera TaxID=13894 RepID=A0A8K0IBJ0_COCNU|nr:disease resistance RPP13-like protein 4 [Cocos nucifera]